MKRAVLFLFLSGVVLTAGAPGIRPRADASSYPAHLEEKDFSIGAFVVPSDQVKKMFKLDLNRSGYVVVEIGIFPAPGKELDIYPGDFTIYTGDKFAAARPVSADTIAEVLEGRPEPPRLSSPHEINTSAGISVGHASYPDPVTGRRSSGTVTTTDAGVGIGGPPPRPCRGWDCDSTAPYPAPSQRPSAQTVNTVSQELWEKSLPDGKAAQPIAGYLYFPKPSKKSKDAIWELRYENANGKTRLVLAK